MNGQMKTMQHLKYYWLTTQQDDPRKHANLDQNYILSTAFVDQFYDHLFYEKFA